ncbi:hypothetical protein Hypma_007015 [Hypsizygus marmoreus]|uniref:Uncharacterized protein n=1 Tax=Hypsizygus marmoreus TaxID=39966 RepID=A0A369KAE2_HYPMA|nr:hypothetical protein Hypma_007015 [Hypsizygus marmoreus]
MHHARKEAQLSRLALLACRMTSSVGPTTTRYHLGYVPILLSINLSIWYNALFFFTFVATLHWMRWGIDRSRQTFPWSSSPATPHLFLRGSPRVALSLAMVELITEHTSSSWLPRRSLVPGYFYPSPDTPNFAIEKITISPSPLVYSACTIYPNTHQRLNAASWFAHTRNSSYSTRIPTCTHYAWWTHVSHVFLRLRSGFSLARFHLFTDVPDLCPRGPLCSSRSPSSDIGSHLISFVFQYTLTKQDPSVNRVETPGNEANSTRRIRANTSPAFIRISRLALTSVTTSDDIHTL